MRVVITFEDDAQIVISEPTADHVWAIESESNRSAAETRWTPVHPKGGGVTIFSRQSLSDLLPTVLEHHPNCQILEVRGVEVQRDIWEELRLHRFVPLRQSPGVLRAGRRGNAA
jgi:hypothetical protein